jgi:hypothetical protein
LTGRVTSQSDPERWWTETAAWYGGEVSHLKQSAVMAGLLATADPRWRHRVLPRTSMLDLLFTAVGDEYPFDGTVRVSAVDELVTFQLANRGGLTVTATRCREPRAAAVLESFLLQLVGDFPELDPDLMQGTNDRRWEPTPGLSRHAIRRRPGDGSWVADGTLHAVDSQHSDAICGTPCPFKWGEWPPTDGDVCPECLLALASDREAGPFAAG